MDKNNQNLSKYLNELNATIKGAYTDISETVNDSFNLGKKEAYDELIQWMKDHHNPEFKYISPFAVLSAIQEKIYKTNVNLNIHDVSELNFSKMKIIENRKRLNPYVQKDQVSDDSFDGDSVNSKGDQSKNSTNSNNLNNNFLQSFQNKKKKFQ